MAHWVANLLVDVDQKWLFMGISAFVGGCVGVVLDNKSEGYPGSGAGQKKGDWGFLIFWAALAVINYIVLLVFFGDKPLPFPWVRRTTGTKC